jgi:hypothetical protein
MKTKTLQDGLTPWTRAGSIGIVIQLSEIAGRDFAPTINRGGKEAEVGKVPEARDPGAARGGSLDDGVLGREAGDAQLQGDEAAIVVLQLLAMANSST